MCVAFKVFISALANGPFAILVQNLFFFNTSGPLHQMHCLEYKATKFEDLKKIQHTIYFRSHIFVIAFIEINKFCHTDIQLCILKAQM